MEQTATVPALNTEVTIAPGTNGAEATASESTPLEAVLADLIALGMLAKHAHWNVVGPTFGSVHALLDRIADAARDGADNVAERAATIGRPPDGRPASVARLNDLADLDRGPIRDGAALTEVEGLLATVTARLRSAISLSEADPVTQDLLSGITGELEKMAWMVRSHR